MVNDNLGKAQKPNGMELWQFSSVSCFELIIGKERILYEKLQEVYRKVFDALRN